MTEDGRGRPPSRAVASTSGRLSAGERDEQHRILVQHSPDMIVVHDGARILFANQTAVRRIGVPDAAALVGRPIDAFLPPDAMEAVAGRIRHLLAGGEPLPSIEVPLSLGGGEILYGELVSAPLTFHGRPAIQTVVRDVTDRRRAETELSATRARYQSLFDGVPIGLYRSTAEGRFLSVNRALVDMLGYPDEATLRAVAAPDLYVDTAERRAWIEEAMRVGVVDGREIRLRHRNGSEVRARLSTSVVRDPDGRVVHFEGALQDVTASRRAEARYRLLFETMAQGVMYHDAEGRIIEANPAAERILGLSRAELLERCSTDAAWGTIRPDGSPLHPEHHPSIRALRLRQPVRDALMGVYNPAREEHRWIEVEAIPLFRPDEEEPYQVYATFEDVTDRRRAEQELRRSEQRLELALAGSGLGLWDWDIRSGEIYLDDRWYLTLGYEPGEFTLHYGEWVELLHPQDRDRVMRKLAEHLSGETPQYECEIRIRAKDGSWKWILDRGRVVERDGEGRPLRATGTHTDIHERKAAEEAQRRSEERLETIFRAAPMGITLSRVRDGTFLEVNDTFAESLGYCPSELVGESSVAAGLWVDTDQRAAILKELNAEGQLRGTAARFRGRDGQIREIQLFTEVIVVGGEPCALTLHRDVTEARRLEEQLRQAQKMEAVGRLAGGIAHDFNNVLTAIIGHVRFLLDALPTGDDRRADAEQIEASADRAKRLTRQLLAFSRQQVLRPRVVNLGEVVASFEPLLARLIGEDVLLEVDADSRCCPVKVDAGQLEQVVLNLAVNARDAMPEGGRLRITSGCVDVSGGDEVAAEGTVPDGRYARLTVSDTGTGMDAATRARVFEPFFTTKPAGKGTGLGLSTVYGIVSQSDGHIAIRTAPGEGTTFAIYLPLVAEEEEAHPTVPDECMDPVGGSETVLLVEDESAVRSLAERVLARAGYAVYSAADGAEALALVDRIPAIDLLLTDMVMPGIGGRELADQLRAASPELRVLFMSGYTADELIRDARRSAGDFLEKPFTPVQLTRAVHAALEG